MNVGFVGLGIMVQYMVEGDDADGVDARAHHKDFGILMAETARLGVPLPLAGQVAESLDALMGRGWGKSDTACLLRVLQRTAGSAQS